MPRDRSELEVRIGYSFRNPAYLQRALTRLAHAKEQSLPADAHMDALAVLGDAVVEVVVIRSLICAGEHDKGIITNRKVNLVNMSVLRRLAESVSLTDYVFWGKGENEQHIWTSGRVLAECIEAVIGAVYLDGGIEAVEGVLKKMKLIN
jgi:ribonuclease-3